MIGTTRQPTSLTERLVESARHEGGEILRAHETMLGELTTESVSAWVHALVSAHATFVEETISAYLDAAGEISSALDADEDERTLAARIRELGDLMVSSIASVAASHGERRIGRRTEWVTDLAETHTRFVTAVSRISAEAVRSVPQTLPASR